MTESIRIHIESINEPELDAHYCHVRAGSPLFGALNLLISTDSDMDEFHLAVFKAMGYLLKRNEQQKLVSAFPVIETSPKGTDPMVSWFCYHCQVENLEPDAPFDESDCLEDDSDRGLA